MPGPAAATRPALDTRAAPVVDVDLTATRAATGSGVAAREEFSDTVAGPPAAAPAGPPAAAPVDATMAASLLRTRASTRVVDDATLPGEGDRVGRFVILRELGRGAMGVVFAAYDEELARRVALKLLHFGPQQDVSAGRSQLLREAQALARLAHPNVVAVYEAGVWRRSVYIAMEYVQGVDLQGWLAAEPRPWREVLGVLRQAGEGLLAAHRSGLVHRDFKPESSRFSPRTPSTRETPRISSLEGVGGKIGCLGLTLLAPGCPGSWPPPGHHRASSTFSQLVLPGYELPALARRARAASALPQLAPSHRLAPGQLPTISAASSRQEAIVERPGAAEYPAVGRSAARGRGELYFGIAQYGISPGELHHSRTSICQSRPSGKRDNVSARTLLKRIYHLREHRGLEYIELVQGQETLRLRTKRYTYGRDCSQHHNT